MKKAFTIADGSLFQESTIPKNMLSIICFAVSFQVLFHDPQLFFLD